MTLFFQRLEGYFQAHTSAGKVAIIVSMFVAVAFIGWVLVPVFFAYPAIPVGFVMLAAIFQLFVFIIGADANASE